MKFFSKLFPLLALLATPLSAGNSSADYIAYVGTYTQADRSQGIYAWRFSAATGNLSPIGLVAETSNPSFLAYAPGRKILYAVNELSIYQGKSAGAVSSFAVDTKTGKLRLLNQVSSRGAGPCHLAVDPLGKWVVVANYDGGSTAEFPIRSDGSLGEASGFVQHNGSSVDTVRQRGPHAHDAVFSPDARTVFVLDLGLDRILGYATDGLKPANPAFSEVAAGSGPRHMAWNLNGRIAYMMAEMSANVVVLRYEVGRFEELQTLPTLPANYKGIKSGAEIAVHPSGKFVYASTRGANTISVFSIDSGTGKLTPVDRTSTQGKTPRNFAIDPTGAYLLAANQDSDNIVEFQIHPMTGKLLPNGVVLQAGSPVCIVFVPVS